MLKVEQREQWRWKQLGVIRPGDAVLRINDHLDGRDDIVLVACVGDWSVILRRPNSPVSDGKIIEINPPGRHMNCEVVMELEGKQRVRCRWKAVAVLTPGRSRDIYVRGDNGETAYYRFTHTRVGV